jgi:tetratricopeptide (TPR) repeat protein
MKAVARLIVVLSAVLAPVASAQSLQDRLRMDIEDGQLDDFSKIEAAFILSGAVDSDTLSAGTAWFRGIVQTVEDFRFRMTDRVGSAKKVFALLHAAWLKTYALEATTLFDVKNRKTFNCVSGTILFNLLCDALGWPTDAFETPTHVYTVFQNFTEPFTVENTSPMGFDIMRNLHAYSRYLAQFYPENRAVQIGYDRLYAYENSKGRPIDNTELLGLLAYNRAHRYGKEGDFRRAFASIQLAQLFNRDSRSNVDFEIDLYYRWGKALHDSGQIDLAFEVSAEGFRRHPEVGDFRNNTRALFARMLRPGRTWEHLRKSLDTVLELDALKPEDIAPLGQALERLARSCDGSGRTDQAMEIRRYGEILRGLFPGSEN